MNDTAAGIDAQILRDLQAAGFTPEAARQVLAIRHGLQRDLQALGEGQARTVDLSTEDAAARYGTCPWDGMPQRPGHWQMPNHRALVERDHAEALRHRCRQPLAGTGGEPCQAPAGHGGRGYDASGQPWSHQHVPPCRRCGQPHPDAASRSACPWQDQPAVTAPAVQLEEETPAMPERRDGTSLTGPLPPLATSPLQAGAGRRAALRNGAVAASQRQATAMRSLPAGGTPTPC